MADRKTAALTHLRGAHALDKLMGNLSEDEQRMQQMALGGLRDRGQPDDPQGIVHLAVANDKTAFDRARATPSDKLAVPAGTKACYDVQQGDVIITVLRADDHKGRRAPRALNYPEIVTQPCVNGVSKDDDIAFVGIAKGNNGSGSDGEKDPVYTNAIGGTETVVQNGPICFVPGDNGAVMMTPYETTRRDTTTGTNAISPVVSVTGHVPEKRVPTLIPLRSVNVEQWQRQIMAKMRKKLAGLRAGDTAKAKYDELCRDIVPALNEKSEQLPIHFWARYYALHLLRTRNNESVQIIAKDLYDSEQRSPGSKMVVASPTVKYAASSSNPFATAGTHAAVLDAFEDCMSRCSERMKLFLQRRAGFKALTHGATGAPMDILMGSFLG